MFPFSLRSRTYICFYMKKFASYFMTSWYLLLELEFPLYARLGVASSVLVHFCQKHFCWYRDTIFIFINYLYLDLYLPFILSLCCTIGASLLLSKVPLLVPRYSLYLYILSFSSLYIIFVLHHRCYCTFAQRTSAGTEIPDSRKFYDQQLNFQKTLCLISNLQFYKFLRK